MDFIRLSGFPHTLEFITLGCVTLGIFMKGWSIVSCLQDHVSWPIGSKIPPIGSIMESWEDFIKFIFPRTSSQDLIGPQLEYVTTNPSVRGTFPNNLLFSFEDNWGGNYPKTRKFSMSTNHGDKSDMEKRCSLGSRSCTTYSSFIDKVSIERKFLEQYFLSQVY